MIKKCQKIGILLNKEATYLESKKYVLSPSLTDNASNV